MILPRVLGLPRPILLLCELMLDMQVAPVVAPSDARYRVDEFVQDAISLRITPFMLDNYAREYEDLVRARVVQDRLGMDTGLVRERTVAPVE